MRRSLPIIALYCMCALLVSACGGGGQTTPPTPTPESQTLNSITLPLDAAPAEQQVLVGLYPTNTTAASLDLFESVYARFFDVSDLLSDPLLRLNKNYKVVPGTATKWELDSSGLIWTFYLDPNLIWSD